MEKKEPKYSKMQLDELIEEHKRVVAVLASESHEDDKRELETQKKELENYIKQRKEFDKSNKIDKALQILAEAAFETQMNGGDLFDNIEKAGKKDLSKLTKKTITDKTGHKRTVWVKMGEAIKEGKKKLSDWHAKKHKEMGFDMTEGSNWLKRGMKNVVKSIKHEVHEWKEAGHGVAKFVKGQPLTDHEKKAIKTVAIHVGLVVASAMLGDITGGAATTGGKVASAAGKLAFGFLEHSGVMSVATGLALTKGDEDPFDILKASTKDMKAAEEAFNKEQGGGEGGEADISHSDDESEHYMERIVLSMANWMANGDKQAKKEEAGKKPQQKQMNQDGQNSTGQGTPTQNQKG